MNKSSLSTYSKEKNKSNISLEVSENTEEKEAIKQAETTTLVTRLMESHSKETAMQ